MLHVTWCRWQKMARQTKRQKHFITRLRPMMTIFQAGSKKSCRDCLFRLRGEKLAEYCNDSFFGTVIIVWMWTNDTIDIIFWLAPNEIEIFYHVIPKAHLLYSNDTNAYRYGASIYWPTLSSIDYYGNNFFFQPNVHEFWSTVIPTKTPSEQFPRGLIYVVTILFITSEIYCCLSLWP